ncbi:MAG: NUDIX hydrolase [Verrucomicrobiales bacterium]|nr:NUDIX hydrolase [Verrucomicrobiales bacterium]
MHRQPLLDLLNLYLEDYPGEEDRTLQFIDFVQGHSTCFERHLEKGHITGSAWIVDSSGSQTLLTHHRKLNLWLQPGGHADGNADVMEVAMQEGLEETGLAALQPVKRRILDLDIHGIPARKDEPSHFHYDVRFLLQQEGESDYIVSEESHDLAWVPMEKLEEYTDEWSMRRMRRKALNWLK